MGGGGGGKSLGRREGGPHVVFSETTPISLKIVSGLELVTSILED